MKSSFVGIAAMAIVSMMAGTSTVLAAVDSPDVPHLRALEEVKPPQPEAAVVPQGASPTEGQEASEPQQAMEAFRGKDGYEQWRCYPGSWHWPRCRWGGGYGCYPGSWSWPSCRWQFRCYPGSWYWPQCRWWW